MKDFRYLILTILMVAICTIGSGCISVDDREQNEYQTEYEQYLKIIETKPNGYKILTGGVDFDDYCYVDNHLLFFRCWDDHPGQDINSILGFNSSETFDIEGGVMLDTFSTAFLINDSLLKQSYLVQISNKREVEADIFYLTPEDYDYILWIIEDSFGEKQNNTQ